jgi:hypothetical protein
MKKMMVIMAMLGILLTACGAPTPEIVIVKETVIVVVTAIPEPSPTVKPTVKPTRTPVIIPTARPYTPKVEDYQLELIVIEKQCFGSAGCLITVRPDLAYGGFPTPSGKEYMLVYEIIGGEDGVEIFNLTIHDDGQYTFRDLTISTAHKDDELTVEIVELLD